MLPRLLLLLLFLYHLYSIFSVLLLLSMRFDSQPTTAHEYFEHGQLSYQPLIIGVISAICVWVLYTIIAQGTLQLDCNDEIQIRDLLARVTECVRSTICAILPRVSIVGSLLVKEQSYFLCFNLNWIKMIHIQGFKQS